MTGALDGVRVLELCSFVSGPFAGRQLADMGAEVVKVERPDPSPLRASDMPYETHGHDTLTWRFLNLNRGKQSIVLDLQNEEGRELFRDLAADADVVLENMRRGVMDSLDIGWQSLSERNPELVFCAIKGYGAESPHADRPAFDTCIQGISGLATQIGDDPDVPETMNVLIVDMITGLYAASSIATALYEREQSGDGQRIEVPMLDAVVSLFSYQLGEYTATRHSSDYDPQYGPSLVPNGYYRTADGFLTLLIADVHWKQFCEALGRPEMADPNHRYATNERRIDRREALREDLESALTERTTDEWIARFTRAEGTIPVAPVNDIEAMVTRSEERDDASIVEREHPSLGRYVTSNVVPKFSRTPGDLGDAPELGEDTDALLEALGLDETERERLRDESVVR